MRANLRGVAAMAGVCTLMLFPLADRLLASTGDGAPSAPAPTHVHWTLALRPASNGDTVLLQTDHGAFEVDVTGATDSARQTLRLSSAGHCLSLRVEQRDGLRPALKDGRVVHCD